MTQYSYTMHFIEQENGRVALVAVDDSTNYRFRREYESASVAALEGIIELTMKRIVDNASIESAHD